MNYVENLKVIIAAVEAQPKLDLDTYVQETECGTLYCVAGLIPTIPHFKELGVWGTLSGTPEIGFSGVERTLNKLFGVFDSMSAFSCLCAGRGNGMWDDDLLGELWSLYITDKELALFRLNKALAIRMAEL